MTFPGGQNSRRLSTPAHQPSLSGDELSRPVRPALTVISRESASDMTSASPERARSSGRSWRGWRKPSALPGFGPTMGFTLLYLGLIVLLPLAALVIKSSGGTWAQFWSVATAPRAIAAYKLSFGSSLLAAAVNLVFGVLVAWVLVRYEFPFKRLVDGLVDLPFALPTAVAGIALATLYSPKGWIGQLLDPWGIKAAYTPTGVTLALIFIGLPFVVRTVQPVLQDLDTEVEEAAASLGATPLQSFTRVIAPAIMPAALTGFALAFARAVGEYGSVIFIAGNIPLKSEISPLLIIIKLEQYDYRGAAIIGVVMLAASFLILLGINLLQRWARVRQGEG
jgi:sulfate transport system permease protein